MLAALSQRIVLICMLVLLYFFCSVIIAPSSASRRVSVCFVAMRNNVFLLR